MTNNNNYVARKTKIGKWNTAGEACNGNIDLLSADVITSELRTHANTLSTWSVIADPSGDHKYIVDDAVIALLTGPNAKSLETIDLIILNRDEVSELAFDGSQKGDTTVTSLQDKHYNIVNLNYSSLGTVSSIFIDLVKKGEFVKVSKSDIKLIIEKAISNNVITLSNFNDDIKPKVCKMLNIS